VAENKKEFWGFQKLNNFLKNNKGLTLIEVLVAMIIGTIMVATMYFSFSVFSGTYLGIIGKVQVSKNIRNSLTIISKDTRQAGYTGYLTVVGASSSPYTSINNKILISKNNYWNIDSYAVDTNRFFDVLDIIYDQDRLTRVKISYAADKEGYLRKRVAKCVNSADCSDSSLQYPDSTFYNYQPIAGPGLEGFKVNAFDNNGNLEVNPSNAYYLQVSVLFATAGSDIFKTIQDQSFIIGDSTITKSDKLFRDSASALIYPRNIKKL